MYSPPRLPTPVTSIVAALVVALDDGGTNQPSRIAFAQVPGVQSKRRRGQSDSTKVGYETAQTVQGGVVHSLFAVRDQVSFIDDDQVAFAERLRIAINRIDRGKQNWCVGVAEAEPVAVDADRRRRPDTPQFKNVLLEQLAIGRVHQHAHGRIVGQQLLDQTCDYYGLAGTRRHRDQRVATAVAPEDKQLA